jgi:hypothetical protein
MTDSEIFDAATKSYGGEIKGPLHDANSNLTGYGFVKQLADIWIVAMRRLYPKLPEIYVGFVDNPTLNAAAFTVEGRYFVAVFAGTIYLFHSVFRAMLSDRRILLHIGDPHAEDETPQSLRNLHVDYNQAVKNGFNPPMPKCPFRFHYVERLFEAAMSFLLLHELAHIGFGDAGYVNRLNGSSLFLELPVTGDSGLKISDPDMLILQAMEMNADTQASIWLMDDTRHQLAVENTPISIEDTVFRRVFAICTFFRMFGDTFFTIDFLEKDHPHDRFRQVLTTSRMAHLIAEVWPTDLRETATAAMKSSTHEVEKSFATLTGEFVTVAGLVEVISEFGDEYLAMLEKYYVQVVMPLLRPYTFRPSSDAPQGTSFNIQPR